MKHKAEGAHSKVKHHLNEASKKLKEAHQHHKEAMKHSNKIKMEKSVKKHKK